MPRIYLDYNATTPVRQEVIEAMLPYLHTHFGNPSSVHWAGRRAKQGLEDAREQVAALIHARAAEVVFTSGGTESNNLAFWGVLRAVDGEKTHIVTTAIEHSSVLETARSLAQHHGYRVTIVPVDGEGRVHPEDLRAALRAETALVSIGLANNEIGTIQAVPLLSRIVRERGILFHVDAVQGAGKLPLDVDALGVDLLSLSAHKIYGPKGIGALYIRKGTPFAPLLRGGAQERERRPGTENVAAAVGFGVAAALAARELEASATRFFQLTTKLWQGIRARIPEVFLNGPEHDRLPNTLNVGFVGASGEGLMMGLDLAGIAVSTGSACAAGALEPSHVLLALGRDPSAAQSAIRFSVGKETTEQEVDYLLTVLPQIVARVRAAGRTHEGAG
ncbi:MAG: cysteine desulfurase [Candidatus Binatia bacterium]|nr:cysteine desulfurase [Candidatus Binatia bacterium]